MVAARMLAFRSLQEKTRDLLASSRPADRQAGGPFATDWVKGGRVQQGVRTYAPWAISRLAVPDCRFVIITAGRTGSELLVSLLDSHPRIMCDSEILFVRRAFPNQLIGSRAAVARLRGAQAYGFKLLSGHIGLQDVGAPAEYLRGLHEQGFRLILLERRDLLQQAISHVRAAGTRYHYRQADKITYTPTAMDPMAIVATMFVLEEQIAFARSNLNDIPHLTLVYEDDLGEPGQQQRTVERVCRHLGVAPSPVTSDLVKITPRSTEALLDNFDELVTALSGTRYAGYATALEAGQPRA
jgi:LPS sulfotransferase NodH